MSREMIKKHSSAKEVGSHLASLEGEIEAEELILQQKLEELANKKKKKQNLQKKLKKLTPKGEITFTEHSLLRYAERVLKIDFEAIKQEILSEEIKEMLKVLPATGSFPNKKGYNVIFKNGSITTITI